MMATRDEILTQLEGVNDPHVPVSLRRMGMLADLAIDDDGAVRVDVCIPCMACPGASLIESQITERLLALDGVTSVVVRQGWHLPWDRESVEPGARELLRTHGIQL